MLELFSSPSKVSEQIFSDVPQVELLQWLARGSLKQNLLRAIRLWVWLRSLYGEDQNHIFLEDGFTLADWKTAFFGSTHPKGETIPDFHDPNCHCAKTTADWLFDAKTGLNQETWKRSLLSHVNISNLDEILEKRLFGVTRRSLQADLQILEELGWLENREQKYHRVQYLPSRPITTKQNNHELNFLNQEDLAEIAENMSQKIGGVQRFFLKLDYVVTAIDEVGNWQYELRKIWEKTPIPPVNLIYRSARLGDTIECLVYPVCIYYVQRAVYLCAFGESPDRKTDWYNFRVDRIENITPIGWTNSAIPQNLQQRYHQRNLPNPEEIELQMDKALGFDFYLESRLMLLRFERDYHDRYIKDTSRHKTFKLISYQKAKSLIQSSVINSEQKVELLRVLANRSPKDAYYNVSAYLIPARGLKRFYCFTLEDNANRFRISNPRKGTETQYWRNLLGCSVFCFRISNPRKGTETSNLCLKIYLMSLVSAYLIPARGLKLLLSKILIRTFV